MSAATLSPADDFEAFEFEALIAGLHTQPMGEPLPDERPILRQRSRTVEEREAIHESLGIRRHRTNERKI